MDLVLVCAPGAEIPAEVVERADGEDRRVIRSRLVPPGYLREFDLDCMSPVPDEWLEASDE